MAIFFSRAALFVNQDERNVNKAAKTGKIKYGSGFDNSIHKNVPVFKKATRVKVDTKPSKSAIERLVGASSHMD